MNKSDTQQSIKKINAEMASLNPSTLVTMFEIDISDLLFDYGLISVAEIGSSNTVFRFHNNIFISQSSIFWKGNEYIAAPITAEGFDLNVKRTLPTPRIALHVNEEHSDVMAILKEQIFKLKDLAGAKVTRIRTFAKYLDVENFINQVVPDGFEPDSNVEFPRDIYFIDRKSTDNKLSLEYELSSIFDLDGIKLPNRLVVANKCMWTYRGAGCLYEYNSRRVNSLHGTSDESTMPLLAPPVATENNEKILDLLSITTTIDKGEWVYGQLYNKGDVVYVQKGLFKYYFASKVANSTISPPNSVYWVADQCSKLINGCLLSYGVNGSANGGVIKGRLPFGGFPSVNKLIG